MPRTITVLGKFASERVTTTGVAPQGAAGGTPSALTAQVADLEQEMDDLETAMGDPEKDHAADFLNLLT